MPQAYKITEEQRAEIQEARRKNKNKNVEKRLKAIELRAEGKTLAETGKICGCNPAYKGSYVSGFAPSWVAKDHAT